MGNDQDTIGPEPKEASLVGSITSGGNTLHMPLCNAKFVLNNRIEIRKGRRDEGKGGGKGGGGGEREREKEKEKREEKEKEKRRRGPEQGVAGVIANANEGAPLCLPQLLDPFIYNNNDNIRIRKYG